MDSFLSNNNTRVRSNSDDSEFDSPEAKRIQHDLLDALEDSDEFDSVEQHLLEFLHEASDDELGLPPTETASAESESLPVPTTESVELGVFSWLDDQIPEYEFDYVDVGFDVDGNNGEHVALDGLFDFADPGFGSSDLSRLPESLPAQ